MQADRITTNPKQMNGQPCIRNMRLTVKRVVELLAIYLDRSELFREFSELEEEDIRQTLVFASSYLDYRTIELPNRVISECIEELQQGVTMTQTLTL